MAHSRGDVLAAAAEEARVRRLSGAEMRKPPVAWFEEGWDSRPFRPVKEAALRFDVDKSTVTRWQAWTVNEEAQRKRRSETGGPAREFSEFHYDLSDKDIPLLVEDFLGFRERFFLTPFGRAYETPPFQQKWTAAILKALVLGGRQMILSPPRHGKTELLIHVAVWLVCRFPNIRILWVGGNERIAQRSVNSVAQHLGSNQDLIDVYAGPGRSFKPGPKDGLSWSKSEFTVNTRTIPGIKGTTMTALGRGGTLLSLDADIIIADDIEDHGSTAQSGARESTREWWTSQLESRKQDWTGVFVIGSRQHPDDLTGHLLENSEYESIVEWAHDPACPIPDTGEHVDCMLFPTLNSYSFLMSQKLAAETTGGAGIFDMVWQNAPTAKGLQVFTPEIIDPCKNEKYAVGTIPSPKDTGIRMVAGLDPSGSGYQAAVLWAFSVKPKLHMWLVDLENQEGGGIAKARETIKEWSDKYDGLRHWVIEENLYHGGIVNDDNLRAYATLKGIRLESFKTYLNKVDPRFGVTALQPLFASKTITLPYANTESKVKTDSYRAQLVYWDGQAPRNRNARAGYKSDLVMASWFPMDVIRRAQQEFHADMGVDFADSYQGYGTVQWDSAPWKTRYAS